MTDRVRLLGWTLLALSIAMPVFAQEGGKQDPDGLTMDAWRASMPEYFGRPQGSGRNRTHDIPDVFGPGAVLTVGSIQHKVTNWGHNGNLFMNVSSDPSAQWPGASGIEYLSSIRLAVGAVNPTATDPVAVRRVSYLQEWRPPTLDPEDRIYRAYDGILNGTRFSNDDGDQDPFTGDPLIDEDFLDGRDNDLDAQIDEDFGASGQQMYSLVMRDDTPQAINSTFNEKHVPLGLECKQRSWAYSVPGFSDFVIHEYNIRNISGHTLDSLTIGWLLDMDAGPLEAATYFQDDFDFPQYPFGEFTTLVDSTVDRRYQTAAARSFELSPDVDPDSALCPRYPLRVNGFSVLDDDGDENKTLGVASFLLIDHTVDPLGQRGPSRVGWKAFRSFVASTPYVQGGNPIVDQQRFEFMVGTEPNGIDEVSGFIEAPRSDQKGDMIQWCSVGPWRFVQDGETIQATVAFQIMRGDLELANGYPADYLAYVGGAMTGGELRNKYPSLDNAIAVQVAFEGVYEVKGDWPILPDGHGRETAIRLPSGTIGSPVSEECETRLGRTAIPNDRSYTFFDFDCNYCTGVWDRRNASTSNPNAGGMFHRTWNTEAPPPSPGMNTAVSYNYSDNPSRDVVAAGDGQVSLAWDNLSETSPDPKSGWFDFRGYRVWKAANWTRPVGSAGPQDDDWALLGEFRHFYYRDLNYNLIPNNLYVNALGDTVCPRLYIPQRGDSMDICLELGDLWDRQSGLVLRPDANVPCVGAPNCEEQLGSVNGTGRIGPPVIETRTKYPIGRYRLLDREVKNGFVYFYSVTAFDSTNVDNIVTELFGRRSAVESEGVTPQTGTGTGTSVWVVPNPYRGYTNIAQRSSSWDLTPNASDPTGTHIDFFGLPPGPWTIKIFTVSGDLVAELHDTDAVNASLRGTVVGSDGRSYNGVTRQQDSANDGQASWNLISRNGQDVVSGVYIYTVESAAGVQRSKFVVIR